MHRPQKFFGAIIGVFCAAVVLAVAFGHAGRDRFMPTGPILSDCEGALRAVVIHYEPKARDSVATIYRQFLNHLDANVTVYGVCPGTAAYQELLALVGKTPCRLEPIIVPHAITTWSRDRWVSLESLGNGPVTLWHPREERARDIWPERAGDEQVAADIAERLGCDVAATRSLLYFDGGDFVADAETVFVTPAVALRNIQRTVADSSELLEALAACLKRRVVLLNEAPDHHAGMFMMPIGHRTVLVGDPSLARQYVSPNPFGTSEPDTPGTEAFLDLPGGCNWDAETQRLFDAVAKRCIDAGYQVVRMPLVPARDGRTYLSYLNVIIDAKQEGRIVYLPTYAGAERLNDAAAVIWQHLGYEVRRVDCSGSFRHFGSLRCLVNVLARSR